eukprot:6255924-Amphidinium_carterae.1
MGLFLKLTVKKSNAQRFQDGTLHFAQPCRCPRASGILGHTSPVEADAATSPQNAHSAPSSREGVSRRSIVVSRTKPTPAHTQEPCPDPGMTTPPFGPDDVKRRRLAGQPLPFRAA